MTKIRCAALALALMACAGSSSAVTLTDVRIGVHRELIRWRAVGGDDRRAVARQRHPVEQRTDGVGDRKRHPGRAISAPAQATCRASPIRVRRSMSGLPWLQPLAG